MLHMSMEGYWQYCSRQTVAVLLDEDKNLEDYNRYLKKDVDYRVGIKKMAFGVTDEEMPTKSTTAA